MRRFLVILFLVPFFTFSQQTVGVFSNTQDAFNGYTLFNVLQSPTTYLIDNCGNKLYEWNSQYGPQIL